MQTYCRRRNARLTQSYVIVIIVLDRLSPGTHVVSVRNPKSLRPVAII